MRRTVVCTVVAIVALSVAAGAVWAENRAAVAESKNMQQAGRVVNSWTVFDDGDMAADTILFPTGSTTGTWQDHYFLIEGGVVTAATIPFSIEQIQYYLQNIWASHATAAVWSAGNTSTYYAVGGGTGGAAGWNTLSLSIPLQITATGFPQWWMGAWNSYTFATPVSCGSCRQVGVDTGTGLPGAGHGYWSDIDAVGVTFAADISGRQPFLATQIPVVRAGITATGNTVPVELMEFTAE